MTGSGPVMTTFVGQAMTDCRIGVVGAAGRMGRVLLRLAATAPGFRLYNVSGLDAVELRLKSGDIRRIGTDDPQGLAAALEAAARAPRV